LLIEVVWFILSWVTYLSFVLFLVSFTLFTFITWSFGRRSLFGRPSSYFPPKVTDYQITGMMNAEFLASRFDRNLGGEVRLALNPGQPHQTIKYLEINPEVLASAPRASFYSNVGVIDLLNLPYGDWNLAIIG
jgi:hypothetical protein